MSNPTVTLFMVGPTAGNAVLSAVAWNAGDTIVYAIVSEDQTQTYGLPSGTGTGTITTQGTANTVASSCWGQSWQSVAASTQASVTITSAFSGSSARHSSFLIAVVAAGTSAGVARLSIAATLTPTISVTRTGQDSTVLDLLGDWSSAATTGRTPVPVGGTQLQATVDAGRYTSYINRWDSQGAAGTTSYGVAGANFVNNLTKLTIEIQGLAGTATIPNVNMAPQR